jgi:Domain of unknown function (DUF4190)
MTDTTSVDGDWTQDFAPSRLPRDRLAVASVVLASLWLWWLGSLAGLVLGIVALVRARARPEPSMSRRWARTGIVLGSIGVLTFGTFVAPPLVSGLRHRFEDSATRATLADFVTTLKHGENAHGGGFPTGSGGAESWTVPGGSDVVVVGPGTQSRDYKEVSAEVWELWLDAAPDHGVTVYAAVLSGSGTCFYLRDTVSVAYETQPFGASRCTADDARGISSWGALPTS